MDETMRELVMKAASAEVFGVWFLIGAALVFWMQAGFAMVEAGFTRAKNTGNIIMKNLMDFCIGTVVFILIGFGLLMCEDLFGFIGKPGFDLFTAYAEFDFSSFVLTLYSAQRLPRLFQEQWLNVPNSFLIVFTQQ